VGKALIGDHNVPVNVPGNWCTAMSATTGNAHLDSVKKQVKPGRASCKVSGSISVIRRYSRFYSVQPETRHENDSAWQKMSSPPSLNQPYKSSTMK
jgi:hypothetical protein